MAEQMPILVLTPKEEGAFEERTLSFEEGSQKVGRSMMRLKPSARNGIFTSQVLSRAHAEVFLDSENPSQVLLMDLESSNGTFINGESLEPRVPYPLKSGDEVQFGVDVLQAGRISHKCISAQVTIYQGGKVAGGAGAGGDTGRGVNMLVGENTMVSALHVRELQTQLSKISAENEQLEKEITGLGAAAEGKFTESPLYQQLLTLVTTLQERVNTNKERMQAVEELLLDIEQYTDRHFTALDNVDELTARIATLDQQLALYKGMDRSILSSLALNKDQEALHRYQQDNLHLREKLESLLNERLTKERDFWLVVQAHTDARIAAVEKASMLETQVEDLQRSFSSMKDKLRAAEEKLQNSIPRKDIFNAPEYQAMVESIEKLAKKAEEGQDMEVHFGEEPKKEVQLDIGNVEQPARILPSLLTTRAEKVEDDELERGPLTSRRNEEDGQAEPEISEDDLAAALDDMANLDGEEGAAAELDQTIEDNNGMVSDVSTAVASIDSEVKEEEDADALEGSSRDASQEGDLEGRDLASLKRAVEAATKTAKNLETEVTAKRKRVASLSKELENVQGKNKKVQDELKELRQSNDQLTRDLKAVTKERDELARNADNKEKDLASRVEEADAKYNKLEQENKSILEDLKRWMDKDVENRKELEKVQDELKGALENERLNVTSSPSVMQSPSEAAAARPNDEEIGFVWQAVAWPFRILGTALPTGLVRAIQRS
eukprot:Clim_evm92s128 gene=Clim_evmTU92s128